MGTRDGLPWVLDEYVVVGDLWLRRGRTVGTSDPEVRALANLLGRSPAAVSRRIGNFAGTDRPGSGLKAITGEALDLWMKLRTDPAALTMAVREAKTRLALLTGENRDASAAGRVRIVAPELPSTATLTVVTKEDAREARQIEAILRENFRKWRDPDGSRLRGIEIPTSTSTLRVDLYDRVAQVLIEVKAHTDRDYLRFAVGQLYDYRRYLDFEVDLAVLVPTRPTHDLMGLLKTARVNAIWQLEGLRFDSTNDRILSDNAPSFD